jgi:hypothetical protein
MSARLILLIVSLLLLAASLLLSLTPLAWHLTGRHAENYPELFFFIYCLPPAILLAVDAGLLMALKRDRDVRLIWLSVIVTFFGFITFPVILAGGLTMPRLLRPIAPEIGWWFGHYLWVVLGPATALTVSGLVVALVRKSTTAAREN